MSETRQKSTYIHFFVCILARLHLLLHLFLFGGVHLLLLLRRHLLIHAHIHSHVYVPWDHSIVHLLHLLLLLIRLHLVSRWCLVLVWLLVNLLLWSNFLLLLFGDLFSHI